MIVTPTHTLTLADTSFTSFTTQNTKHAILIAVYGKAIFTNCTFTAERSGEIGAEEARMRERNDPTSKSVCEWESSLIEISGERAEGTFTSSVFANSTEAPVEVDDGGAVQMSECTFANNTAGITAFPSLCRNALCRDASSLSMSTERERERDIEDSGERESEQTEKSMWILSSSECSLSGNVLSSLSSPFFIPHLSNATASSAGSTIRIAFSGECLIPCSLAVQLSFDDAPAVTYSLSVHESETSAQLILTDITDVGTYTRSTKVSACLVFNDRHAQTSAFILKEPSERRSRGGTEGGSRTGVAPIVLIIAVGGGILLATLITITIVCCCCRRCRRKQKSRRLVSSPYDEDIDTELSGETNIESSILSEEEMHTQRETQTYTQCEDTLLTESSRETQSARGDESGVADDFQHLPTEDISTLQLL